MTIKPALLVTLHAATHRVRGVPAHAECPTGHQGSTHHGRTAQARSVERRTSGRKLNHAPDRPPRVLVAWQRRIAALLGQEL